MPCNHNTSLTVEQILMKLQFLGYTLRKRLKEDNPSLKYLKGDNYM